MFYIVCREPCGTETRLERTFETGQDAKAAADDANKVAKESGAERRYIVRREMAAIDWRGRERNRFTDGIYKQVPWHKELWFTESSYADTHFAHVSTDDPLKLAFTEDNEKGSLDRQTRMLPGRYLVRFFTPTLDSDNVRFWCTKFAAENESNELLFANDADEFEEVYTNGPSSCMAYACEDSDGYESSIHPVRVYAAGDLQLAYLRRNGSITARAIVWPAKKIHTRLYGDADRLRMLLNNQEYKYGPLDDARLCRIEHQYGFVLPYIDGYPGLGGCDCSACGSTNVRDDGDFLIIDASGDIEACRTNGVSEEDSRVTCEHCDDRVDDADTESIIVSGRYSNNYETWCSDCAHSDSFCCDDCDNQMANDPHIETQDGRSICERCAENYSTCVACNEHYHDDQLTARSLNNEPICVDCVAVLESAPCGRYDTNNDSNECCADCHCERSRQAELPLDLPNAAD